MKIILTLLLVLIGTRFGGYFAESVSTSHISAFWPVNALLFSLVISMPAHQQRIALALSLISYLAAELWIGFPIINSVLYSFANVAEVILLLWLLKRAALYPLAFDSLGNLFTFLSITVLAAVFGGAIGAVGALMTEGDFGVDLMRWSLADFFGYALFVPLFSTWRQWRIYLVGETVARKIEFVLLITLVMALSILICSMNAVIGHPALLGAQFLPLPFLLWAALRFGPWGGAIGTIIVGCIVFYSTVHGAGPFAGGTPEQSIWSLQLYFASLVFSVMTTACLSVERTRSLDDLMKEIKEHWKTEQALLESEAKYRRIVNTTNEGICLVDAGQNITFANPSMNRMLGYANEEMIGRPFVDFIADEEMIDNQKRMTERRQGVAGKYERCFRANDGHIVWGLVAATPLFDDHHRFVGSLAMVSDITEHRRAVGMLRESEEKFRNIFEHAPVSIAINDLEGTFIDVNAQMCGRFGLGRDALIGRKTADILRCTIPDHPDRSRALVKKLKSQGWLRDEEIHLAHPSTNERMTVSISSRLITIGEKLCVLSMVLDITERKRLEIQLHQAQKMESVGRLAGGVAHDFNNLLTAISGNIEMALMEENLCSRIADRLKTVKKAAAGAADLTRQLLAFSRQQIIEQKVVDLGELLKDIEKMLGRLIGEDIRLFTFCKPGALLVKVDPSQMQQIVMNLAVNARDAMPNGGVLTLEASSVVLDETYCRLHKHAVPGEHIVLAVTDTGGGMTEQVKEHLFEPFFTTKSLGKGTGLGLATVYGAVKQNNGTIEVYSEPGQGTCFKIYFPQVAGDQQTVAASTEEMPVVKGTETILVVEDNLSVLQFNLESLKLLGYRVLAASNSEEAMQVAREHAGDIDLLMTDVVMPGMNGRQVSDMLTKQYPRIRTLFCSGYTENTIVHHGVLDPHLNFIGKPYSIHTLASKIRSVLNEEEHGVLSVTDLE